MRICCAAVCGPSSARARSPTVGARARLRCAPGWRASSAPTPSSLPMATSRRLRRRSRRRRLRRSPTRSRAWPSACPPAPRWLPSGSANSSPAWRPTGASCRFMPIPARRSSVEGVRSPRRSRCRCSAVTESSEPPLVVKVGGGLLRDEGLEGLRRACAEALALAAKRPVLVVPGGGPFADAVRAVDEQVGLGAQTAHALALQAMDQLGVLLRPLLPGAELLADLVVPRSLGLLQAAP